MWGSIGNGYLTFQEMKFLVIGYRGLIAVHMFCHFLHTSQLGTVWWLPSGELHGYFQGCRANNAAVT